MAMRFFTSVMSLKNCPSLSSRLFWEVAKKLSLDFNRTLNLRTGQAYLLAIILGFSLLTGCTSDDSQNEQSAQSGPVTSSPGYDEMSESYYEAAARVIWQRPEIVMNVLGEMEGITVADIGAGTGYFAFRIAAAGADVIAIDVDPRAVSFMDSEKKRYPAEIQERFSTRIAEPTSPNLKKSEVDVVLMVNTYIYIDDRVQYFEKLQKGLKDNGQVVIIDFKKKETTIGPKQEDRISIQQVQRELSEAGYTIVGVDEETLEYQYLIKAVKQ